MPRPAALIFSLSLVSAATAAPPVRPPELGRRAVEHRLRKHLRTMVDEAHVRVASVDHDGVDAIIHVFSGARARGGAPVDPRRLLHHLQRTVLLGPGRGADFTRGTRLVVLGPGSLDIHAGPGLAPLIRRRLHGASRAVVREATAAGLAVEKLRLETEHGSRVTLELTASLGGKTGAATLEAAREELWRTLNDRVFGGEYPGFFLNQAASRVVVRGRQ